MKAIITKYLPATDTKGSRIKASAEGVKSVVISWNYVLGIEANHAAAARGLCEKYAWGESLIAGSLPDQTGYAFVFSR